MLDRLRTACGTLSILGFGLVFFLAIGSLAFPHAGDQALYAWVGSVILDGGVPYKDAWELKGPLTHYIHAIAMLLFGRQEVSIRIVDLAALLGSCGLLRRLVLRLNPDDNFGANCAAIFFGLMYYAGGFIDTAQPEGWGGMLILGAVVLLVSPRPTNLVMASVGALIALATLIKPTFLIYILLPCISVARRRSRNSDGALPLLTCLLSFALICIASIVLLFKVGALGDFVDVIRYLQTTYQHTRTPFSGALLALPTTLFHFGLLIPYLLVPIGFFRIRRISHERAEILIASWFILANLLVVVQGRYWYDHWLPASIATAPFMGVALSYVICRSFTSESGPLRYRVFAVMAFLSVMEPAATRGLLSNYLWPSYALGVQSKSAYIAQLPTSPWSYPYQQITDLARHIRQLSGPDDQIAIWGWDPAVFMMSERKSATRFCVSQPLVDDGPLRDKYQHLFLHDIETHMPRLIVINTVYPGLQSLRQFVEFERLLNRRYTRSAVVGTYQIWMLATPPHQES